MMQQQYDNAENKQSGIKGSVDPNTQRPVVWIFRNLESGGMQLTATKIINSLDIKSSVYIMTGAPATKLLVPWVSACQKKENHTKKPKLQTALSILRLARYLRRIDQSTLMPFGYSTIAITVIANKISGSRHVVVGNVRNSLVELGQSKSIASAIRKYLTIMFLARSDHLIVVSKGIKDTLGAVGIPLEKIDVIPNGIDRASIISAAESAPIFRKSSTDGKIMVTAGRLEPQKNHKLLITAFAIARRSIQGKLLIIGEGSERSKLEQLIKDLQITADVKMLGFLTNPFPILKESDIYICSSNYEGYPNSLIEAMSLGCAIISTDCPTGPAEVIQDDRSGILVPINDLDQLVEAIVTLCNSETTLNGLRKNSEILSHNFQFKNTTEKFSTTLRKIDRRYNRN